MKLSFVIPVYNAQKYLRECVESVAAWPWPGQKEIVLTDDGSTDSSGQLCDELKAGLENADTEIRVIHQKNGGVSRARNAALEIVTGNWIWMVDADDRVLWEHLSLPGEDALAKAARVNTGFVWDEAGKTTSCGAGPADIPYNLWRCWFRRDIIEKHHLRFTVGRKYAEDQEFILNYLLCLNANQMNAAVIPIPVYYYTLRPGSAMTKPGSRNKQARDIFSVTAGFLVKALFRGRLLQSWTWCELRRLTRTLIETLKR